MAAKFVIKKSSDGQFHFNLKSPSGEELLSSELYKAKASAHKGIASVKKNAPLDHRYDRKLDKAGHPRFNLKAANGEVIGSSESYPSESAREAGIESVKKNGPTAVIEDETRTPPKSKNNPASHGRSDSPFA